MHVDFLRPQTAGCTAVAGGAATLQSALPFADTVSHDSMLAAQNGIASLIP